MTQLESDLGVRLLDRTPRGVKVNTAGWELYARANSILRQFDDLPNIINQDCASGTVSLGVPVTVGLPFIADLVELMQDQHPGIRLEVHESFSGYLRELLEWERVDLAVLYREASARHPGEELLYHEDLYLIGQPGRWFEQSTPDDDVIAMRDMAKIPVMLTSQHSNLRKAVDNACRNAGVRPNIIANVEALRPAAELVARGRMCTILPSSVIDGYPDLELDGRRIVGPEIRRYAALITAPNHDPNSASVLALRNAIRTLVESLPAAGRWRGITPISTTRPTGQPSTRLHG